MNTSWIQNRSQASDAGRHWITVVLWTTCVIASSVAITSHGAEPTSGGPNDQVFGSLSPNLFDSRSNAISQFASSFQDLAAPPLPASSLSSSALSLNQLNVGSALDHAAPASSGNFLAMIDTLNAQTPAQQRTSLALLSGDLYGNTQTIGLQVGDLFQQRIVTRLVSNGRFLTGASFDQMSKAMAQSGSTTNDAVRGQFPTDSSDSWVQGYTAAANLLSDGNTNDLYYSQAGLQTGFDLASDETGRIGVVLGNTYVGFNSFTGGGDMVSNQFGLYALKQNDSAYILGSTNYGYDSFHTFRNILIGGVNQTTRGRFMGNQFGTYLESGLKIDVGLIHLQPLAGLQYLYLEQQGFGENGGVAALEVSRAQADSLRTNLGGRIVVEQLKGPRGTIWTPYWHGRWVSELLNNDRSINATFIGAPVGSGFAVHGDRLGQNYGIIGKGLQVQLNDRISMFANYDGMFGGRIDMITVAGGAVLNW